jgi:hypothetical protein
MKKIGWFSRLSNQQPSLAMIQRIAGGIGVAILLMMTGIAAAQNPTPAAHCRRRSHRCLPRRVCDPSERGSGRAHRRHHGQRAMYDTLVNLQSGPRVLGETFEMRALPGKKNTLVDSLSAIGSGFGGDPYNFAKLDFSKGKLYEFSGLFRRDRQYFDYDLLGNPNIPGGQSIPIGPTARQRARLRGRR